MRERNSRFLLSARSLLLTGIGEVWSSLEQRASARDEGTGLVLMIVSAAMFSLMAAMAKLLLPHTPPQAVVLSRGVLMSIVCIAVAMRRKIPIVGKRPGMLVVRGLLGYAALSCYFYSVQHLPLGDAVLLQYSHPAFVAMLAPIVLHEKTTRGHWALIFIALLGVALIVGPDGEMRGGALVGLTGAMFSGLAYIAVRQLARTEHPLTIMVWFPLATIPGALVGTLLAGREALPRNGVEIAGHLAVFACALLGQVALTAGLVRARAARATAASMAGPVFGLLFGLVLFGTRPSVTSLVGTALVVTALWKLAVSSSSPDPAGAAGASSARSRPSS